MAKRKNDRALWEESPELSDAPFISHEGAARAAVRGAEAHLEALRKLLGRNGSTIERNRLSTNERDALHWRVRAFFWELVGAFDLMLQWSNDRFQLKLPAWRVVWANVIDASADCDPNEWEHVRAALQGAWNSEWYFEVRTYRNYAHRAFMRADAMTSARQIQVFLPPARVGQARLIELREHLGGYVGEMLKLGGRVFARPSSPPNSDG